MSSFDLQRVTIHGHEVVYRRCGEGPPLLLIHGMAGSSTTWREAMPILARSHDVIAPDLVGHGGSAKPPGDYSLGAFASGLRDLMGVLDVPRATVVGQSLGGGVAMQLAYQHPELVERMVLVSSGGLGREVSWLLRAAALPGSEYVMPALFPAFVRSWGDSVSRFLLRRGVRAPRAAAMWDAYAGLTEGDNRKAFVRTLRAVVDAGGQAVNANDRLYLTARMATLIIWGDNDPIIPVAHAQAAHEAMPGSRLEIFEGCGHFPHAEEPLRFTDTINDFVRTTDGVSLTAADYLDLLAGRPPQTA